MLALRILAVVHALSLSIGETWRSWGAGRHFLFVFDDYWVAALLLAGAWAMKQDTVQRRALFAAGWGANAGMLYGSFFGKLVEPASTNAGNWSIGVLTWLVGLAFVVSVGGMIATFAIPRRSTSVDQFD